LLPTGVTGNRCHDVVDAIAVHRPMYVRCMYSNCITLHYGDRAELVWVRGCDHSPGVTLSVHLHKETPCSDRNELVNSDCSAISGSIKSNMAAGRHLGIFRMNIISEVWNGLSATLFIREELSRNMGENNAQGVIRLVTIY